ncbi:hypothetical protein FACS189468_7550 [Spirochaetia bacterium]|nr:hypothetical protein FACS189468_7550 [Spirochaetia bacterium]
MDTAPYHPFLPRLVVKILINSRLRPAALRCIGLIFKHFFLLQYRAALFPGRIPVSRADHPLDKLIPFSPHWVAVYLDFVAYWIRIAGFLLDQYGDRGVEPARDFIESIGKLYTFAVTVYGKNLSTTDRPRYFRRLRFLLIHGFDPHLMCIPSLHVMIVIRSYTAFRAMLRSLGDEEALAGEISRIRRGALDITEAVLYVKQHSVNCISAAMYAMTRFDPPLFPPEEAEGFVSGLFIKGEGMEAEDCRKIREHIGELYRRFIKEGEAAAEWEKPLLDFLKGLPGV